MIQQNLEFCDLQEELTIKFPSHTSTKIDFLTLYSQQNIIPLFGLTFMIIHCL